MKVTVCFKAITDYSRLSREDWVWDEHHAIDMGFVRRIFNCFDESALEMALKLSMLSTAIKDLTELTALTIDDQKADLFLKQLSAVGYDPVRIQMDQNVDLRFNALAISLLIAAYVKKADQQLVILGQQGGEGDNRQTGQLVAERLGWPCIREVTEISRVATENKLIVFNQQAGKTVKQTVKLPVVLTIGQAVDSPYLRVPTLKQKLAAKKNRIKVIEPAELEIKEKELLNDKRLIDFSHFEKKSACVFIEGQNSQEKANNLYQQFLKERLVK